MKTIALTTILALCLIGCGSSDEATATNTAPTTTAPAATTPAPTDPSAGAGAAPPTVSDASNQGVEQVAPGQAGTR